MQIANLEQLLTNELQTLHVAERQILNRLPEIVLESSSSTLRSVLREYLDQTQKHIERLDKIFNLKQLSPQPAECKGLLGILEEGSELSKTHIGDQVIDVGVIAV